ncbi:class I SAM-dependent methyltransferase [Nocardioides sp. TRM66260-LWL]|uniref:class I SAM-dependent methyltransferase n=1 Tax=Nocardioides sp. TRM66260-LWL TaxID=2874478 RepID=UPI001CC5BD50|nr:class I SAM-dependent methyltransferase [Nocardioides sp. TRM66260-LWL]MBZ5734578.1 class I SAM-dependent methyltransferase [Nocardioides sp. TRM66260-LWL]
MTVTTGASGTPARPTVRGEVVPAAFDDVARTYDLMVRLSPGYHEQLRASAAALVEALPETAGRRPVVFDLGCGSGASTAALVHALRAGGRDADVVGVDGSAGMLIQARRKRWPAGVTFRQADAETLGRDDLAEADGVFAAYLLRNVAARDRLLAQVHDVLRPGGVLVVHDYSVRDSLLARLSWHAVCWGVVIPLGLVTAPRSPIYRYLWRSVLDFDGVQRLADRMVKAGFVDVESRSASGWQRGQVHTWRARR